MHSEADFIRDFGAALAMATPLQELWVTSAYTSVKGARSLRRLVEGSGKSHAILGCNADTEWKALKQLEEWGVSVQIMPDPPQGIFHPKAFYAEGTDGDAWALVGSANLTDGGLRRNIEAGIRLHGSVRMKAMRDARRFFGDLSEGAVELTPSLLEQFKAAQEEIRRATREVAAAAMGPVAGLDPNQAFRLTPLGQATLRTVNSGSFLRYVEQTKMEASYKMVILAFLLLSQDGRLNLLHLARLFLTFYQSLAALGFDAEKPRIVMRGAVGMELPRVLQVLKGAPKEALTGGKMVAYVGETVEIVRHVWEAMTVAERERAFLLVLDRLRHYYRDEVGFSTDFVQVLRTSAGTNGLI